MKPVWSLLINNGSNGFILFAITPLPILYTVFSNVIGRQFLIYCFGFVTFWYARN